MPDSCDQGLNLLPLELALQRLLAESREVVAIETIALRDALGRILADPVLAPAPFPRFDNAAMDGYALCISEAGHQSGYRIEGESAAGLPFEGILSPGACVRIFTGAKLPVGADAVVMQEEIERVESILYLLPGAQICRGDHIRRAGEELRIGDPLFPKGRRLRASDLGLLAAAGLREVQVFRQLKVGFIATGDELQRPGEALGLGQIYESNRPVLRALLESEGFLPVDGEIVPDQADQILGKLESLAPEVDVILTLGGASVGDHDHLAKVVGSWGKVEFWKVAIKPGKPFLFGEVAGIPILSLPGNPVSMMVTFLSLARPFLQKCAGMVPVRSLRIKAVTESPIRKAPGRLEFRRGVLSREAGDLKVQCLKAQGSHQLTSMSQANCFVVLESETREIPAGGSVWVEPFPEALQTPIDSEAL